MARLINLSRYDRSARRSVWVRADMVTAIEALASETANQFGTVVRIEGGTPTQPKANLFLKCDSAMHANQTANRVAAAINAALQGRKR